MPDYCNTPKQLISLFWNLKKNIQKDAIIFDDLFQMEEEKMFKINKLFCCSHYLVGLADQAGSCLKMWASIIYKDGKVV